MSAMFWREWKTKWKINFETSWLHWIDTSTWYLNLILNLLHLLLLLKNLLCVTLVTFLRNQILGWKITSWCKGFGLKNKPYYGLFSWPWSTGLPQLGVLEWPCITSYNGLKCIVNCVVQLYLYTCCFNRNCIVVALEFS